MRWIDRALLCATLCFCALAPAAAQVDEATAERVMRSCGLWEQIVSLGPQVRAGLEQAASQQPPGGDEQGLVKRLADAADEAFGPVAVRVVARRELAARLEARHLPVLTAWLDSAVGRRITALEVAASAASTAGDDPQARARAGQQRLENSPAPRRALLQSLLEATRASEAAADSLISMLVTLQTGVGRALGRADLPTAEQLRAQADGQRAALQQGLSPMLLALNTEAYATLSDAELESYVSVLQTPAGRHLTDVVMRAMDRVMVECTEEMTRRGTGV